MEGFYVMKIIVLHLEVSMRLEGCWGLTAGILRGLS